MSVTPVKAMSLVHCVSSPLGPGALSRALLELGPSRIRKLIILEDSEQYLQYLYVRSIISLAESSD